MKYLKIFEDFDQYDVRKYDNDTNGDNYRNMRSIAIEFDLVDVETIMASLNSKNINTTYYDSKLLNDDYGYIQVSKGSIAIDEHANGIEIYYFGDYSFGVADYNFFAGRGENVEVIDGIYDLIDEVTLRYQDTIKRNKINEGFDKYDFTTYTELSSFGYVYTQIESSRIPFDVDEMYQIRNDLDTDVKLSRTLLNSWVIVNVNSATSHYYYVYNLGDYCYSITTFDRSDSVVLIEIVDTLDAVLMNLKNKIS